MYFLSCGSHSPLSQLPIEILTEIFHLASIGDPNLSFQQQKIALLKITWVTRHWRIVVLDCPRFWSTIHIGFDTEYYDWVGNKQRKVELRYPRVCVYRSKGVPISLFVDPTQLGKARTTQFLKDLLTKKPHQDPVRIQGLTISVPIPEFYHSDRHFGVILDPTTMEVDAKTRVAVSESTYQLPLLILRHQMQA